MCIIFATISWPENTADAISLESPKFSWGACPHTPLKELASAR